MAEGRLLCAHCERPLIKNNKIIRYRHSSVDCSAAGNICAAGWIDSGENEMYNESAFVRRNILMEESGVSLIPCRKKEKRKKALSSPPILTELLINGPL